MKPTAAGNTIAPSATSSHSAKPPPASLRNPASRKPSSSSIAGTQAASATIPTPTKNAPKGNPATLTTSPREPVSLPKNQTNPIPPTHTRTTQNTIPTLQD